MKKVLLLYAFLWGISLSAQQDIKLPGVVVQQNSQYQTGKVVYLSNAEVKSAGAAPQRSDANGQFTLVFADRPGGDVARIFAAKSGYEVVNEEEMKQACVIGRLRPLKIVMCEQGKLYENQMAYYNIAKDASLAAYERKMATLQKQGKESERLLAELRVQFNHDIKTVEEAKTLLDKQRQLAEQQAKELADKWVTVNLDDQSPAYQRAFAAFEAKNIELAKAILDSVGLEQRLALNSTEKARELALVDTLQKNIAKRVEEIEQDVNMCLFKARLHKLDFEWAKAEYFYDLAGQYDKSNYDITFEVAFFMDEQNQFSKAQTYYEKAITQTGQVFERATILNNLGILLSANNEMGGAKKAYEEALQIRRQLAEKNPDVYLPDVATTLNNLGTLFHAKKEMSGAKKAYDEALQIRRQLAEKNPDAYLPHVATTLNNLGVLLKDNDEMGGAKKAFDEAMQIYRQFAQKKPYIYLPEVAATLNNLGILLSANDEMGGAKKAFDEGLQIYRQFAQKNPDVYLPDMASTLSNLGLLLKDNNEMDGAKKVYEEALQIRRQLAEKNPDVYRPTVATILNNLAILYKARNEFSQAQPLYEEALQIRRQLAEKNPDVYLPDVASTLNNLGALLSVNNKMFFDSKKAFDEALEIYRQLSEKNLDVYRPYVAGTLNNLGLLLSNNNEMFFEAKKAIDEALGIYRQLAEKNLDVYRPYLATTLNNLGLLLSNSNEMFLDAEKIYKEASQIYRQLAEKNPQMYNLYIALTDINIGLLYEQLLETAGDVALISAGLELVRDAEQRLAFYPEAHPLVQQYKPYVQRLTQFFKNFDEMAFQVQKQLEPLNALEAANRTEKDPYQKIRRQQEMLNLLSEIEKAWSGNDRIINLIVSKYGSLAWYQLFVRQFAEAEQSARAGLAKDPKEEWINTNLALALLYQGKWEAAKQIYENLKNKPYGDGTYKATFLEDLDALEKEGITHPDAIKVRELLGKK